MAKAKAERLGLVLLGGQKQAGAGIRISTAVAANNFHRSRGKYTIAGRVISTKLMAPLAANAVR